MISLNLLKIDQTIKNNIIKRCVYMPPKSQYNDSPQPIYCFKVNTNENTINLPMGLWREFSDEGFPNRIYPSAKFTFNKELLTKETDPKKYRDQDVVFNEAVQRLEKEHTIFLNLPTGFGKTITANKIIEKLGIPTMILSYSENIRNQWLDVINENSNAKVQNIKSGNKIKRGYDIYIMGTMAAANINSEDVDHIGLVIVDELHQTTQTCLSQSLLNFQPKYLIGLSATAKRADGLHKLFELYFGKKEDHIIRKEIKPFIVYKINTPFKPEIKYKTYKGKTILDFTTLSTSLANDKKRNDFIIQLIEKNSEYIPLILVDRKENCKYIYDKLKTKFGDDNIGILMGTTNKNDKLKYTNKNPIETYKKIIGTKQACGTGIDIKTLNMLILGFSCKDGIDQIEGRVRSQNCIIYDLVDDFVTLENHWKIREKWYLSRGAEVKFLILDLNGNIKEVEVKNNEKSQERKRYIDIMDEE